MNEHQEAARDARLKLRGLLRVVYAADETLRRLERSDIRQSGVSPPAPVIAPERLSALLGAVEDATSALDVERRRMDEGSFFKEMVEGPGTDVPLPESPVLTAIELRAHLLRLQECCVPYLAECLRCVDFTTEPVQAEALPGASFQLLAFDVLHAVESLTVAHMDLAGRLSDAARRHFSQDQTGGSPSAT